MDCEGEQYEPADLLPLCAAAMSRNGEMPKAFDTEGDVLVEERAMNKGMRGIDAARGLSLVLIISVVHLKRGVLIVRRSDVTSRSF